MLTPNVSICSNRHWISPLQQITHLDSGCTAPSSAQKSPTDFRTVGEFRGAALENRSKYPGQPTGWVFEYWKQTKYWQNSLLDGEDINILRTIIMWLNLTYHSLWYILTYVHTLLIYIYYRYMILRSKRSILSRISKSSYRWPFLSSWLREI